MTGRPSNLVVHRLRLAPDSVGFRTSDTPSPLAAEAEYEVRIVHLADAYRGMGGAQGDPASAGVIEQSGDIAPGGTFTWPLNRRRLVRPDRQRAE
jgi:hypothetical protein